MFGICRGLQELNVLFGGTLERSLAHGHHRGEEEHSFAELFDYNHDVTLTEGGVLAGATGARRLTVNSVHLQGIDRLGAGLAVEAVSIGDGLVEAVSARPCGAEGAGRPVASGMGRRRPAREPGVLPPDRRALRAIEA